MSELDKRDAVVSILMRFEQAVSRPMEERLSDPESKTYGQWAQEIIDALGDAQTPRVDRKALADMPTHVDENGVRYGGLGERTADYYIEHLGLHEEYAIATYYSEDGFPTYYPMASREEALEWKRPFAHRIPWEQYPVSRLAGEWTRLGEDE